MGRAKPADKSANDAKTLERISEAVEKLRSEVEALRGIIGRLQDEVAWCLTTTRFVAPSFTVNQLSPCTLPACPGTRSLRISASG